MTVMTQIYSIPWRQLHGRSGQQRDLRQPMASLPDEGQRRLPRAWSLKGTLGHGSAMIDQATATLAKVT
jgi:hypothetical protein